MIANRRRPGTTSRKSSSRLAARSAAWFDRPVTLPPGRARLATRPVPRRDREDDRDNRCRLLCRDDGGSRRDNDIDLQTDELGRNLGVALAASLRPPILDRDAATLDPTKFAQTPHESGGPMDPG